MFSYETEYIIRKIQNKILTSRENVSLREILSAPIHDAVKVYFRASIADKHGSPKRFHSERTTDVEKLKHEIDLLLPTNYTLNKDTFISLVTDAVHFHFNFLCRPRWTMGEFFFHNSTSMSVAELKQGFLYFAAYDFYPKILFRYLQKKKISRIDRPTFDTVISKINQLALGEATPDDFVQLLKPLADFVSYGRENRDNAIPEHAVALFFEDIGFGHIRRHLESTLQKQGIEKITPEELRSYIDGIPREATTKQVTPEPSEEPGVTDHVPPYSPPFFEKKEEEFDAEPFRDKYPKEPEPDSTSHLTEQPPVEKVEETQDSDIDLTEPDTPIAEKEPPVVEEPLEEPVEETFPEELSEKSEEVDQTESEKDEDDELFRPISPVDDKPEDQDVEESEDVEMEDQPEEEPDDHKDEHKIDLLEKPSSDETDTDEEFTIDDDLTETPPAEETQPDEEIEEEPPPFKWSDEGIDEDIEIPDEQPEEEIDGDIEIPEDQPIEEIEEETTAPEEYTDDIKETIDEETDDEFIDEESPVADTISEEPGEDLVDTDDMQDEEPYEEEPLEEEEVEEAPQKRQSSTMPPLDLLIDDDERKRFVRKLFNGDSAYYNVVIETLNKMTSWKEASLYIDEIFLMNGVDPYSTDSVNFTDKVYTRFSHKSKYR